MWVLASFYYHIPPQAIVIGIVVASVAVLAVGLTRRVVVGLLGGMFSSVVIGYFVIDAGQGDLRELTMWLGIPCCAVVGGLAGGIVAGVVQRCRVARPRTGHEQP